MLSIWMIWRVGETDLRALTTISRVLDHFGEKAASIFYPSREIDPKFDHICGSRSARNTFSGPMWERKGSLCFLAIFLVFFTYLYAQRGHRGAGRLKEG